MRRSVVWFLLAGTCFACRTSTEPLALSAQLHAGPGPVGGTVICTLVNHSADTLYAAGCCAKAVFSVDQRTAFRWDSYAGGICLDICPRDPEPVLPHDSITGSVGVFDAGTFRLRVDVSRTWRGDSPSTITSAAFVVR